VNVEHVVKGRVWREVGRQPHTRRDGSQTELIRWATPCRTCGALFEVTTPSKNFEKATSFTLVNCKAHRMTPMEASLLARKAQKTANEQKKANSEHVDLC
jgi:hypothetical protein